jgi:hypothetical protein
MYGKDSIKLPENLILRAWYIYINWLILGHLFAVKSSNPKCYEMLDRAADKAGVNPLRIHDDRAVLYLLRDYQFIKKDCAAWGSLQDSGCQRTPRKT